MSPIVYIEARCDRCEDEITNCNKDETFAFMTNGDLACKACANKKPDQVKKWWNPPMFDLTPPKGLGEIPDIEEPEEYPCTICDFIAKSENGLGSHMRAHERRGETVTHADAEEYAKAEIPEKLDDAEVAAEEPEEAEGR